MHATGIERLRALLRDLAPDDRAVLECRIVDEWHYGDIAAHLSLPGDVLTDRVRWLRTDLRRKAKALRA
jgi:DNA-directed RNA polymerase specialized sigma24 family protein